METLETSLILPRSSQLHFQEVMTAGGGAAFYPAWLHYEHTISPQLPGYCLHLWAYGNRDSQAGTPAFLTPIHQPETPGAEPAAAAEPRPERTWGPQRQDLGRTLAVDTKSPQREHHFVILILHSLANFKFSLRANQNNCWTSSGTPCLAFFHLCMLAVLRVVGWS